MTDTGYQGSKRSGYTEHANGYSGAFSWFTSAHFPGEWLVLCHESSFAKETTSHAVVDNFGSLVRVPA